MVVATHVAWGLWLLRRLGWWLALALGTTAWAEPVPKVRAVDPPPATVLYVGNSFFSFNDGLNLHVEGLLDAADPENGFTSKLAAIGGSALSGHDVEAYLRPVFRNPARPFDVVVLADCSQCPVHPQLRPAFHEYVKKHSETIRRHGAVPVLFMTWAYADHPEMTAQLAEQYTLAGNSNAALVIPVGLAFARALSIDPRIRLHDEDRIHPSLAGTYLSACTVLAALHGKSPVGNSYTAGLDRSTATFLQHIAAETVTEYLRP